MSQQKPGVPGTAPLGVPKIKVEVLQCCSCRQLAISISGVKVTGHNCNNEWRVILVEAIPTFTLANAVYRSV